MNLQADGLLQTIDRMADGTIMVDDNGVIVYASARMAEMFGYRPSDLVGRRIELLVPEDDRAEHQAQRTGYTQDRRFRAMGTDLDIQGLRSDGTLFPIDVHLMPLNDGLVAANVRDVSTERVRAASYAANRAALARAQEREQRARATFDMIVQNLFAVATGLAGLAQTLPTKHAAKVWSSIKLIDETIALSRPEAPGRNRPGAL